MVKGFGTHYMADIKTSSTKINDLLYIFQFLDDLPAKIGMTKITQPYVFPYSGLIPSDKGITGTLIIAESHISLHSFTEKNYFFFDLFSCNDFDTQKVETLLMEAFDVKLGDITRYIVKRGLDFPRG